MAVGTKRRRETGPCTGRGFSAIDADGYLAKLMAFAIRQNANGSEQLITTIDHTTNRCTVVGHGLVTGQSIVLVNGTAPAELTLTTSYALPLNRSVLTEYFAIKISDDVFEIASTHYNAMAGTAIDFTDNGSGDSTISVVALGGGAGWYLHEDYSQNDQTKTFATTDVDVGADTITITGHGFTRAHRISFSSTGTLPAGLTAGTVYFANVVDANTLKVFTSESWGYYGGAGWYLVNLTDQGSGTHTVTAEEHFIVITDTESPSINDYNTSPAGCAPKFLKIGYKANESGYVRTQGIMWWDNTTHLCQGVWGGYILNTYDSALFAYQFIGGDEFFFQSTQLGSAWHHVNVDTFTGISSILEGMTKVGVLQSGISAGSSVVLQLDTGEAANFTVDNYYYLYDFDGHFWVDYVQVTAVDVGTDQITIDTASQDFPAGAVIHPYAHRYVMDGFGSSNDGVYGTNRDFINWYGYNQYYRTPGAFAIPYCSAGDADGVRNEQGSSILLRGIPLGLESSVFTTGDPDDMGLYYCAKILLGEAADSNDSSTSMNRIYGKLNNILRTARDSMGTMVNTRTLNSIEYLYYTNETTSAYLITYTESAV